MITIEAITEYVSVCYIKKKKNTDILEIYYYFEFESNHYVRKKILSDASRFFKLNVYDIVKILYIS